MEIQRTVIFTEPEKKLLEACDRLAEAMDLINRYAEEANAPWLANQGAKPEQAYGGAHLARKAIFDTLEELHADFYDSVVGMVIDGMSEGKVGTTHMTAIAHVFATDRTA